MITTFTRLGLLACVFLASVAQLEARKPKAQPLPPPEKQENEQALPQPRSVPQQLPPARKAPALHYSYRRISRYEVWNNLAVDQSGRFRPVVIYSPYGSYYRYNGQPFPWTDLYPWEFAPFIMGPSYRAGH
jgi:hypothetical protein